MLGNLVSSLKAYGGPGSVLRKQRTRLGAWGVPITALPPKSASTASAPTIASVTGTAYLGSMVITGSNFGASQTGLASVVVCGVTQSGITWTNGTLTIASLGRGTIKYGVPGSIVVTNSSGGVATYALPTGIQPQTGYAFVNLTSVTSSSGRIRTTPTDIVAGDQIAYGNILPSGVVTVNPDGSFTGDGTATSFVVEVNDGTVWGSSGTITVSYVVYVTLAQATAAILAAGRTLGTVTYQYDPIVPTGDVISQAPAAGTIVVAGTAINLVVSLGVTPSPVYITAPNIVGLQFYPAQAALAAAGFTSVTETYTDSISQSAGTVLSQSISAGTSVLLGTTMAIVVSSALTPAPVYVPVPTVH